MRVSVLLLTGTLILVPRHDSLTPVAEAVLQALRGDKSSLAHIRMDSDPTLAIERPFEYTGWESLLLFHYREIGKSASCEWRGLSPDSIITMVRIAARADSNAADTDEALTPASIPSERVGQLIEFVSPEFHGMHWVAVFKFYPQRETQGGRLRDYKSFNQGVEYIVCGSGRKLEVLSANQMWYD